MPVAPDVSSAAGADAAVAAQTLFTTAPPEFNIQVAVFIPEMILNGFMHVSDRKDRFFNFLKEQEVQKVFKKWPPVDEGHGFRNIVHDLVQTCAKSAGKYNCFQEGLFFWK